MRRIIPLRKTDTQDVEILSHSADQCSCQPFDAATKP
jgi:hypothetical protein